jgi:D-glycero-D-manno-heptose 1,7-bisphosphate phosphatase
VVLRGSSERRGNVALGFFGRRIKLRIRLGGFGQPTSFTLPSGFTQGMALAINNASLAAGFIFNSGSSNTHAALFSNGTTVDLGAGTAQATVALGVNDAGWAVVVVTNQSVVARGWLTEDGLRDIHRELASRLAARGAVLDAIYYCPHHPAAGSSDLTRACDCRKPGTGLLDRAARELDIDIGRSYVVGDKWRAGARSVLVRTGFGPADPGNLRPRRLKDPDYAARDIADAVEWILNAES